MWSWYIRSLNSHPLLTRALTSALLAGCADALAQSVERRRAPRPLPFSPRRTARLAIWALASTPVITMWFNVLASLPSPWLRVAADQAIFAPLSLAAFVWASAILDGTDIGSPTRTKFVGLLLANWAVWPLFQLVNFSLVPRSLQVFTLSLAGFFWTVFVSMYTSAPPQVSLIREAPLSGLPMSPSERAFHHPQLKAMQPLPTRQLLPPRPPPSPPRQATHRLRSAAGNSPVHSLLAEALPNPPRELR